MKDIYIIFAIVGWSWAVLVALFLAVKLRRKVEPRGFEIVERHER